jgi:flagellar motor switch/type III secretory pathway protein FliN
MPESAENTTPQGLPDPWAGVLPCTCVVTIDLSVSKFRVRDLLQLERGSIVETRWKEGSHLPLQVNRRQVGWVEFQVAGDRLAVQVTELL